MQRILALCAGLVLTLGAFSQRRQFVFEADGPLPRHFPVTSELKSGTEVEAVQREALFRLQRSGHLEAAIDSCTGDSSGMHCRLHVGPIYQWARLSAVGGDAVIAADAKFRERAFSGKPISPGALASLFADVLDHCSTHGYPFAQAKLDSLRPTADGLVAALVIEKGRQVKIDSVVVKGTAKTSLRYLYAHIGVRPGDPYNERAIANVALRIRELAFVQQKQAPYVQFTPDQTKLYLFLDARKASSANGIIGLQPDAVTGKVTFTGDVDLRLRNALRRGEAIELNWRKLQDKTQDLRLGFNVPFLFNTPFGIDLSLKIFRRDTTFLEVNARGAVEYLLPHGDKLSVFVNNKSSKRLGRTTVPIPGLADVELLSYGLGLARQRLDYRFNPRKGYSAIMDGSAGNKRSSTAVFGEAQSEATEKESLQVELNGNVIVHLPIKKRSTVRIAGQGGWMANETLFSNELYRIGGLKTMRGVDEASIFCSAFAIGTLEYRFLFEENGNFFAFVDMGWWEDQSKEERLADDPVGFGIGASFETKAGIFGLTYALGQQFSNPIDLREGKVHFGFTSLF
ncbi:MAG: BamA/TamA family outer membrane protein [Flavobacteriales bacterium]